MAVTIPLPVPDQRRIKVPVEYENIMRWLLQHPDATITEGARAFGRSPGWFATVINSDLFIARYQEWMHELDQANGMAGLAERLRGTQALALDRMNHLLEHTNDPDVVLKANDILARANKAAGAHVTVQGNLNVDQRQQYALDPRLAAIQAGRSAMLAIAGAATPETVDVPIQRPGSAEHCVLPAAIEVQQPRQDVVIDIPLPPGPKRGESGQTIADAVALLAAFDDV